MSKKSVGMEIPGNKNLKYCLVTNGASLFTSMTANALDRAGLYNWLRVFQGEVRMLKSFKDGKELDDYDLIHVNLATGDIGVATTVRKMIGDRCHARLIVNMDYSVNYFQQSFDDYGLKLPDFNSDLMAADLVFGVDPEQVAMLSYFMGVLHKEVKTKRSQTARLIPHPVDLETISAPVKNGGLFVPYNNRMDILAFQWHKYDGHWHIPKMILHDLPAPTPNSTVLVTLMGLNKNTEITDMPQLVMPYIKWADYIYFLSHCLWGFEYRRHPAASRFIMEAGALGIPVVSTHYSFLGSQIFPELTFQAHEYEKMHGALSKLITDDTYRMKMAKQGLKNLIPYDFQHSSRRLLEPLIPPQTQHSD